jgi:hypothetical protein
VRAFISHNNADRETARLLATLLVEQGVGVWFDEWDLRPGDSLIGGVEKDIAGAEVFILVWSRAAHTSRWVGTELRTYLRRRVDDEALRIVPLMLDDTPLPALVADYKGFAIANDAELPSVAEEIAGKPTDVAIAKRLQQRLHELAAGSVSDENPHKYLVCTRCASANIRISSLFDDYAEKTRHFAICADCNFMSTA